MTSNSFNSRLQPITLSAATTGSGGQTVISLSYCFNQVANACTGSPSSVINNGTLVKITNNRDNNRSQNFTYDALNRVATAYTDGTNWGDTYTVDAWGNLSNKTPMQGKVTGENLQQAAAVNNRFLGMSYDASGNLLADATSNYTYDAENRIKTAAGVTYTYDGNGERVAKSTGVLYWGGTGKDALDESDAAGNLTNEFIFFNGKRVARRVVATGAVYYYFADHLGSSNVITDASGARQAESDFYPYGGEVVVQADATANHYKFTGKERDTETGVDYFFARYYSSALGRFLTPDWSATPAPVPYANLGDPQSLSLYSYVGNNPITGTDPDGHFRQAMFDSPYGNEYSDSPGPAYDPVKEGNDTTAHTAARDWAQNLEQLQAEAHAAWGAISQGILNGVTTNNSGMKMASDFSAGAGDTLSTPAFMQLPFLPNPIGSGMTAYARRYIFHSDSVVNTKSTSYSAGKWTARAIQAAAWGKSGALGPRGRIFGTRLGGNNPWLNRWDALRIGWTFRQSTSSYFFRIGGDIIGAIKSDPHIWLWPASMWFK